MYYITFFDDPDHPLRQVTCDPDDISGNLIGGVDLGMAQALADYAHGVAQSHARMAEEALLVGDKQACKDQIALATLWTNIRDEARAAHSDIARIRAN